MCKVKFYNFQILGKNFLYKKLKRVIKKEKFGIFVNIKVRNLYILKEYIRIKKSYYLGGIIGNIYKLLRISIYKIKRIFLNQNEKGKLFSVKMSNGKMGKR